MSPQLLPRSNESYSKFTHEAVTSTISCANSWGNPSFLANGAKGVPSYKVGQSLGANGGRFNASGRGFPDVSAAGKHFATFLQGQFAGTVDGTSAGESSLR